MAIYKCCWNCENACEVCAKDKNEEKLINASKRFCEAPYPIASRLINPFQQRYCKQFFPLTYSRTHIITKAEASELNTKTPEELLAYWKEVAING